MYREHITGIGYGVYEHGLSLCIQGTLYHLGIILPQMRFIPVYTGNAVAQLVFVSVFAVYPCVYRERQIVRSLVRSFTGLSLCIQGTLLLA